MNPPEMDHANFDFSEVCQPNAPPRNAPEINTINNFHTHTKRNHPTYTEQEEG
jgi:hypothetical protein